MPRIATGAYELEIIASPEEQRHDHSYIFSEDKYQWTSAVSLRTFQSDEILKTAFIAAGGGGTGVHKNSLVVKKDRIAICCSNSIFCLSIPELDLLWRTKADEATCFEIFPYQEDYIVHGELEISRLDSQGNILWHQSGADIFTCFESSKDDFIVNDDYILATDWDGRKYKFDFDGNILK